MHPREEPDQYSRQLSTTITIAAMIQTQTQHRLNTVSIRHNLITELRTVKFHPRFESAKHA